MMKKLVLLCSLLFVFIALVGCTKPKPETTCTTPLEEIKLNQEVKLLTPGGIPYLGLGGLIGTTNLTIEAVSGADPLKASLIKGDYDIIVAPINLGAMLYNKNSSKYQLAAILTMNNAYLVASADKKLDSILDLKDNDVIAFGETGIPGSLLKKVYETNNLSLENVDFTAASSQAAMQLWLSNQDKYVLLSEPEISKLVIEYQIALKTLDLRKVSTSNLPQAALFVNPNTDKDLIDKALNLIANNVNSLNNDPNLYAANIVSKDRIFNAMGLDVIKRALPLASITYRNDESIKKDIANVLELLGVSIPNEEFYR